MFGHLLLVFKTRRLGACDSQWLKTFRQIASDDLLDRRRRSASPPPSPAAVSQEDTGCVCVCVRRFGRPSAPCLTSSCSLCSDSAPPCLGPGPNVEPAPRSVDPQLQLRDGRFCLPAWQRATERLSENGIDCGMFAAALAGDRTCEPPQLASGADWCYTNESHTSSRSDSFGKSAVREELRGVFVLLQARSRGA